MTDFFENLLSNGELQEKVAELQAYKDVNEDFKKAWEELKAENDRLKEEIKNNKSAYQVELGAYNMECGNLLEENKNLIEENERLKEKIKEYKKYKFLFEKAKEFKEKTDKWASKCLAENEDLKDTIKRTVCQAECFRYKQANKYKQTLQEIKAIAEQILNKNEFVYMNYRDVRQIIRLITKAEEE